jgi:hypothetical protein
MPTKRRAFFSFHYADIFRVNVVRKSQEFLGAKGRSLEGFYDGSLWESAKRRGDSSLKDLIRGGVQNTSVVCVLVGSETSARRWVRYEIARSVIDGKGLLAVNINGITHHSLGVPAARGANPCAYIGVAQKLSEPHRIYRRPFGLSYAAMAGASSMV